MRRIGILLTGMLLVAVAPSLPVPAEAASERVITLGHRSVFTARETSSILVRLPEPQPFFKMKSFRIDSHGDGRLTGFMLIQQGVPKRDAAAIHGLTIGRCNERACKARKNEVRFVWGSNFRGKVPKGIYRLYVVADGAPVTVTVRAERLAGDVAARPNDPVKTDLRTLTPRVDVEGAHSVYSAGDFTRLDAGRPDFAFMGLWVTADAPAAATAWGDCIYYNDGRADPPEDRAFLPGCPEGDGYPFAFPARGVVATSSIAGGLPHGIGAWYSTTSPVSDYGAVGLWIDL